MFLRPRWLRSGKLRGGVWIDPPQDVLFEKRWKRDSLCERRRENAHPVVVVVVGGRRSRHEQRTVVVLARAAGRIDPRTRRRDARVPAPPPRFVAHVLRAPSKQGVRATCVRNVKGWLSFGFVGSTPTSDGRPHQRNEKKYARKPCTVRRRRRVCEGRLCSMFMTL